MYLKPMKGGNEIEKSIKETIEFCACICNGAVVESVEYIANFTGKG